MRHLAYALLVILSGSICTFLGATTIPFTLVGKLIIIEAHINGRPGNFIIDTGVEHLVLNSRYYRGRDLPNQTFYGVTGQPVRMEMGTYDLQIGDAYFDNLYTEIVYLHALERSKRMPIHGLIGIRVLQRYALLIDFALGELSLLPELPQETSNLAVPDTISFRWKRFLICLPARVGDQELLLALDTGAEIGWLTPPQQKKLLPYLQSFEQKTTVGSINAAFVEAPVNQLRQLRLGQQYCPPARFIFGWLHAHNSLPGPRLHGLIGYYLLEADKFAIDFRQQHILVWRSPSMPANIVVDRMGRPLLSPSSNRE